jgi:tetratricopeptide (TPR) repeat protein
MSTVRHFNLRQFAAAAGLVIAAVVAYHNILHAPFIFDDRKAIVENPTIRRLVSFEVLRTPSGATGAGASGRPLVNLSLALNYAIGGLAVEGYHVVNLAIHICAGLLLFGLVRRTLNLSPLAGAAFPLAWTMTLLWLVHPLQTESVTCVVQRSESLVGLFYLLTLYCFVRSTEPAASGGWAMAAVVACLAGMMTKESMVTAPVVALLYDRTFVAGSFRKAWQQRGRLYLGLAATWLFLGGLLVARGGSRGAAAGFGLGITWWNYALTQCGAIVHYLRLVFWPHPLVVDYGTRVMTEPGQIALPALFLVLLVAATLWALWRAPRLGFLGATFFLLLAPSSSVVPLVAQTVAEHRMYLPLAAVIALVVLGLHALIEHAVASVGTALAIILIGTTVVRNSDYSSELGLWQKTVAACPGNARAHLNLGFALANAGRNTEAMAEYEKALELVPSYADAHYDLGLACFASGQTEQAIAQYEQTLALDPQYQKARQSLASALARSGLWSESIPYYETSLRSRPNDPEVEQGLGFALLQSGRPDEAIGHLQAAVRLAPNYFEARNNLGALFLERGQIDQAVEQFEAALRLQPDNAEVQANLGSALFKLGRAAEAIPHYAEASRLDPENPTAAFRLANALLIAGRAPEAINAYDRVLQLQPDNADAHYNLATALAQTGRTAEAIAHFRQTLRLRPGDADTINSLRQLQADP